MADGDPLKAQQVAAAVTWAEAMQAIDYQEEAEREKLRWDLMKMEWLAHLLGSDFKAPDLGGDSPASCNISAFCDGASIPGRCEECRRYE